MCARAWAYCPGAVRMESQSKYWGQSSKDTSHEGILTFLLFYCYIYMNIFVIFKHIFFKNWMEIFCLVFIPSYIIIFVFMTIYTSMLYLSFSPCSFSGYSLKFLLKKRYKIKYKDKLTPCWEIKHTNTCTYFTRTSGRWTEGTDDVNNISYLWIKGEIY